MFSCSIGTSDDVIRAPVVEHNPDPIQSRLIIINIYDANIFKNHGMKRKRLAGNTEQFASRRSGQSYDVSVNSVIYRNHIGTFPFIPKTGILIRYTRTFHNDFTLYENEIVAFA